MRKAHLVVLAYFLIEHISPYFENSALIFENMLVVFINFKNFNLFRFFGSHDLWLHFSPYHNVYFFEFNLKFLIDG
jgi:hypothetical protein